MTLIKDGMYGDSAIKELAKTGMSGQSPNEKLGKFIFSEDGKSYILS